MEFEELQQIWDSQNNEPLYAFSVKALHNRILSKKRSAVHIANFSEIMLILVNLGAAILVASLKFQKPEGKLFMYLMSGWMALTALYIIVSRIRRIRADQRFDRSLAGDLQHAISTASYQIRLSRLMRWNILPLGVLIFAGIIGSGKSVWLAVIVVLFLAIAFFAGGWENGIYESRKRELEELLRKLG